MTTTIETLKHDQAALLTALTDAGAHVVTPKKIRCPFHDDQNPSAGVYDAEDGSGWKYKCHGCEFGGDVFDVQAKARGVGVAEVMREVALPGA